MENLFDTLTYLIIISINGVLVYQEWIDYKRGVSSSNLVVYEWIRMNISVKISRLVRVVKPVGKGKSNPGEFIVEDWEIDGVKICPNY